MDRSCFLITIPISHFCEKARWALERAGVAYEERPHLQLLHRIAVRRAGGGKTAPVLVCGDRVFADSAAILAEADARAPADRRLYPEDVGAAAEIRALEADLDCGLGPHGRRWMYNGIRDSKGVVIAYNCTGVPAWERRALPLLFPLVTRAIDRVLMITPESAARSLVGVRATFDEIGRRLEDGRPYLFGERFTAADLTFSALASSVVMPPEYGVPLPGPEELPEEMATVVRDLRAHPAGEHALRMYREERR